MFSHNRKTQIKIITFLTLYLAKKKIEIWQYTILNWGWRNGPLNTFLVSIDEYKLFRKQFLASLKILRLHTFSQQKLLPEMFLITVLTDINTYVGLIWIVVVKALKQSECSTIVLSGITFPNKLLVLTSLCKDLCLEAPKLTIPTRWFISLFYLQTLTTILPNYDLSFFFWDAERPDSSCNLTDISQIN